MLSEDCILRHTPHKKRAGWGDEENPQKKPRKGDARGKQGVCGVLVKELQVWKMHSCVSESRSKVIPVVGSLPPLASRYALFLFLFLSFFS